MSSDVKGLLPEDKTLMTRQRDNRSDWDTMSAKQRRAQRAGMAALSRRDCTRCMGLRRIPPRDDGDDQCPRCHGTGLEPMPADQQSIIDAAGPALAPKARGRNVQHEDADMDHLFTLVEFAWWAPGFQRFEHRGDGGKRSDIKGGRKRKQQGAQKGWPDCGLIVPRMPDEHSLRAYCEVKAEHVRPKRALPERWWVGMKTEMINIDNRYVRVIVDTGAQSKAGVDAWQIYWLDLLHRSGHATHVAYGAEDAFQWLDAQAGPIPELLPWLLW